jgi:hypothetical protein
VIALIVTPDGFPLAYEVLPGNRADCTTLRNALCKIEAEYGKTDGILIMDCGIPSGEILAEMRKAIRPSRISLARPRAGFTTREGAAQTPLAGGSRGGRCQASRQDQEMYVLAQSHTRINKERAMRRRKLKMDGHGRVSSRSRRWRISQARNCS